MKRNYILLITALLLSTTGHTRTMESADPIVQTVESYITLMNSHGKR